MFKTNFEFLNRFVIPIGLLKLLSWKELETLVCGKPILDIELLKENTVYRVIRKYIIFIRFNLIF